MTRTFQAFRIAVNKELEHFAAMACHDLQEPLRKFMAFGERLSKEYEPVLDEQGKSYLERMDKAAKRMKNFINDLLQYSKVTTRENSYQVVDMNKMMAEILEILEFQVSRIQGEVVVDNLPHATFNGQDAQLDTAIKYLQQKLKDEPIEIPMAPPYPVRPGTKKTPNR